ncbi:uncharacterized protein LOC129619133 [Condylostylus longicornis]|uniref:uncharacterized protein LOC129619133 n=1 Tax=Condylostylus longicornis TaxID=2530218 RepID=UPI00244DD134|nr:uncharacterized protein LOC129619133 [Condylostylus longicornis]
MLSLLELNNKIILICMIFNLIVKGNVISLTFDSENGKLIELSDNEIEVYEPIISKYENNSFENNDDEDQEKISSKKNIQHKIRYTLGHRFFHHDKLLAESSNNFHYNGLRNIILKFCYPKFGFGSILTSVVGVVDQLSDIGHAFIISGGIGHRNICVGLVANATTYLNYKVSFYGLYNL